MENGQDQKLRLDNFLRSRGLRIKLLLSFMLLVFITTVMMFILTYTSTRDLAADKIRHRIILLASVFSKDIDNEITITSDRLEKLARFSIIQDMKPGSVPPYGFVMEYLEPIGIHGVMIFINTPDGFDCSLARGIEKHICAMPEISEAAAKRATVAFSLPQSTQSQKTIFIATPSINRNNQVSSIIVIKKNMNTIDFGHIIQKVEEGGPGIQAFLVDDEGIIISNPDSSHIGKNIFSKSMALHAAAMSAGNDVSKLKKQFIFGRGKSKFIGSAMVVNKDIGWRVIIFQPYNEVFQAVRLVSFRILFVGALALIVAFGLALYRSHRIIAPIGELLTAVSEIARGDYTKRVKVHKVDEVGLLALAFNRMSSTLEEKITALQQSQEQLRETFHQLQLDAKKREQTNLDLSRKVKELTSLSEVTRRISDTLELNEILETIVNTITDNDLMGFSICSIKLLDMHTKTLENKVSRNLPEEYLNRPPTKVGSGISGKAAQSQSSIIIENLADDPRVPRDHILLSSNINIKSMCCIPLISKKSVVGILNIYTSDFHIFTEDEMRVLSIFANQAASAIENAQLFEDLRENYFNTIEALSMTIDAKDPYTHGHSKRVSDISVLIGRQLGLPPDQVEMLKHAGELHDIGKIGISERVIAKEGKLTVDEYEHIKTHPLIGATIIEPVPFLKDVKKIIRHHHERHDGYGYPDGLKDDEIPLMSRILHIADAYDAMTSDRPYRKALSRESAIAEIMKHSGTQFAPDVVEAFAKVLEDESARYLFRSKSFIGR